jgi:hypothetical protein
MAGNSSDSEREKRRPDKPDAPEVRRLWSPPAVLAGAAATGVGLLTTVYLAANQHLTGWHYLVAILFGGASLLLIVEAFYRSQAQVAWSAPGMLGALCAVVSITFVALPTGHHAGASAGPDRAPEGRSVPVSGNGGLTFTVRPVPGETFHLALYKPIPLPGPRETPADLRRRGGTEVGFEHFRMILADRGAEPISVLSVRLEVLGSRPRPEGTLAYKFTQGAEGLGRFTATIDRTHPGAVARLYESRHGPGTPAERRTTPPYFATTYILLRSGEVYPGTLAVRSEPRRLVRFRFVAEGQSAGRKFVRRSPAFSVVGGFGHPYEEHFDRVYVEGQFPGFCTATPESPWYDGRLAWGSGATRCPKGPEAPKQVPLADPGAYPPGRLHLALGVEPGAQSAAIDGIQVGRAPAAEPVGSVAAPLLHALGAWSACYERWPTPGYWTAVWERWGLVLSFADDGSRPCDPSSRSPVRQIEVLEWGEKIQTDGGTVTVGRPPSDIPAQIEAAGMRRGRRGSRSLLLEGGSPCDPRRLGPRPQVVPERAGGILALDLREVNPEVPGEKPEPGAVERAVITLPGEGC